MSRVVIILAVKLVEGIVKGYKIVHRPIVHVKNELLPDKRVQNFITETIVPLPLFYTISK